MALGRRGGNTETQFNVELKGVSKSTVAIGDSVAIHTPAGSRLIRTVGSEVVPEPRPRPSPVVRRPHRARAFVGRASEVAAAGQAGPGAPFQVHGADGVGKSALLEHLVFDLPQADDGVVQAKVRRRGVYDIQAQLFKAFWECAVRFTPAPEEMSDFLGDRRALVVLDDVGLDRSDLEELIDTSPGCTFVIGSEEQTLWRDSAVRLAGLDDDAALELIELRLDRRLAADERVPATAVKPPQAPATGPPKVRVDAPARGARYAQGERVLAAYGCAAAHDAQLRSCRGSVPSGSAIDTSEGRHEFRVVARDSNGRREEITIPYSVTGSSAPPTQADETRPTIRLTTPAEGGVYAAKSQITADFACLDERGGSGMKSCSATVADGELIDTSPGAHEFKVTAVDRAKNTRSETVQYRVERSSPLDTTDPEITITMPAANASYDLSQTVLAAYACDDGEGSGIETCEGSVGVGEPIDTATVGEHTFRVTAEDGAGNRTERSATYDVEAVVAR